MCPRKHGCASKEVKAVAASFKIYGAVVSFGRGLGQQDVSPEDVLVCSRIDEFLHAE